MDKRLRALKLVVQAAIVVIIIVILVWIIFLRRAYEGSFATVTNVLLLATIAVLIVVEMRQDSHTYKALKANKECTSSRSSRRLS